MLKLSSVFNPVSSFQKQSKCRRGSSKMRWRNSITGYGTEIDTCQTNFSQVTTYLFSFKNSSWSLHTMLYPLDPYIFLFYSFPIFFSQENCETIYQRGNKNEWRKVGKQFRTSIHNTKLSYSVPVLVSTSNAFHFFCFLYPIAILSFSHLF